MEPAGLILAEPQCETSKSEGQADTFMKNQWLISWIGKNDHECAEGLHFGQKGPISSALSSHLKFDRVCLLTNYDADRSSQYCDWLQSTTGYIADLWHIPLSSPTNYAEIYESVTSALHSLGIPNPETELTFHLSPGTPAMAAIWIMLAKTRFPAKLIQTSREQGLEEVNFFFDLAGDFLPEFLKRSNERIERLSSAAPLEAPEFAGIIHQSNAVRRQIQLAQRFSLFDVPVLILGETGTGKELFAEAIHRASSRQKKPFIVVNCGAIPRELANSELFGHKRGAFTGADADRKGCFQEADGGTLFLDEVGDLPLDTQVRLLRALQQKEISPVGVSRPITVDVRIIAATHRDLAADVAAGKFREDLFHRLAVGILRIPALRDRGTDLSLLIDYFIDRINDDTANLPDSPRKTISQSARSILLSHHWPGNIRELYHTLLRASIWTTISTIEADDIREALLVAPDANLPILDRPLTEGFNLAAVIEDVERHYITKAMNQCGHRKKMASTLLGYKNYQTLSNRMEKLGLTFEESSV